MAKVLEKEPNIIIPVYPVLQTQLKLPGTFWQTAPFLHGPSRHSLTSLSQALPVKPSGQLQENPPTKL